jgi:transcriptional regulator with XRE-family HTH domain
MKKILSEVQKSENKLYLITLGAKIRALREGRNMTMTQMAAELKTKYAQVWRIEQGEVNSTVLILRDVAKILKVKLSHLVKD